MTTPIEPTEEQYEAAASVFRYRWSGVDVADVARLLAEREHRLRASVDELSQSWRDSVLACAKRRNEALDQADKLRADLDAARARIAELEEKAAYLQKLNDAAAVGIEAGEKLAKRIAELELNVDNRLLASLIRAEAPWVNVSVVREQNKSDLDAARARIADLEAEQADTVGCEGCGKRLPSQCAVSTGDPVYLCARCVSPMHMEREAAHLAHIKALREALQEARPSVEAWVTGDGDDSDCQALQTIDEALADTAHYDVEGGAL